MNGSSFSASREAGQLVVVAVGLFTLALLVAIWTLGEWEKARRLSRARDLRLHRAHRKAVAHLAPGVRPADPASARVAGSAQRARAAGVDELLLDDDFAGFAEYGGALRQDAHLGAVEHV